MKRVLVTGATGFVGRHCLAPLAARGFEVHAVSRGPRDGSDVAWHQADLLDVQAACALMETVRPTHLLHVAWYVEHGRFWQAEENLPWVEASLALLRAFRRAGGRRVVGVGTCAEYDRRLGYCVENLTPLAPDSLYGAAKHALQGLMSAYASAHGLSAAWARLFHLYGPAEAQGRLVPTVIQALLRAEPAACTPGTQWRDFLHVADAASACVALLDGDAQGPVNIGSGEPVQIAELVGQLGRLMARPDLIRLGARAMPPDEAPFLVADTRRLREEVGWRSPRTLEAGLLDTVSWWRDG